MQRLFSQSSRVPVMLLVRLEERVEGAWVETLMGQRMFLSGREGSEVASDYAESQPAVTRGTALLRKAIQSGRERKLRIVPNST